MNSLASCRALFRVVKDGFRLGQAAALFSLCIFGAQYGRGQEAVTAGDARVQLGTQSEEQPIPLPETLTAPRLDAAVEMVGRPDASTFSTSRIVDDSETTPEPDGKTASDTATGSGAAFGGKERVAWTVRPHVAQELIVEGLYSYGNYTLWASGWDQHLYTAGVEYDRHSWGHFLHAQMDYVAEFLPLVLLKKPVTVDVYGNPEPYKTHNRPMEIVPGIGIAPIGFRWQWLSDRGIKPYLELKGGMLVFAKKVPNAEATYQNFSLQSCMGVQVRMNERWGLRLGLFSDFHFSNGYMVAVDPGLDVMNANLGVSYHF